MDLSVVERLIDYVWMFLHPLQDTCQGSVAHAMDARYTSQQFFAVHAAFWADSCSHGCDQVRR